MNAVSISAVALVALTSTVGCQSKMYDENTGLRSQNVELQQRNRELESEIAARPQPADMTSLQGQLADRDKQIADLEQQLRTPAPEAPAADRDEIGGITVSRDDAAGTVTVAVPGDVLFASGDSAVKSSAKGTLDKVAAALKKDYAGKKIVVIGHTDSDPISRTKDKWKDNLDLSAGRARTVGEYLVAQGLDKRQVGMRAMADTAPKGTKAQSRRVEIVVATR